MANNKKSKKCVYLYVISILLIVLVFNLAYVQAQNETNQEIKETKSWFSGIIDFFRYLFNVIFQINNNAAENLSNNATYNLSENLSGKEELNKTESFEANETAVENLTTEISNVTNISEIATNLTCSYCQYLVNNTCLNYSCCKDEDCQVGEICALHICTNMTINETNIYTSEYVWNNKDSFMNQRISMKGDVSTKVGHCTASCNTGRISPCCEPCCAECEGYLMLGEIRVAGNYNGQEIKCLGNECDLECYPPLEQGKEYIITGVFRGEWFELETFELGG
jgi:hypothetical protein